MPIVAVHARGTLRTSPEVNFSVAKPFEKSVAVSSAGLGDAGASWWCGLLPPASASGVTVSASAMLSFLMMVQKPPALRMS